nr:carbonic anhydrase family protein [Acinetobacter shaoyimingii]
MKKLKYLSVLTTLVSSMALADEAGEWSYDKELGPAHWAQLNSKYASCSGLNQSPINIDKTIKSELEPLKFDYKDQATVKDIVNLGHTVQVNFEAGAKLIVDGKTFNLKQFHLHTPSENLIKGKQYPLEMHMVHVSDDGELAVMGLMFDEGKSNISLAKVMAASLENQGRSMYLNLKLSLQIFSSPSKLIIVLTAR